MMMIAEELKKLFPQLFRDDSAQVTLDIADVSVRIFGQERNLELSTPVYFGGNFIPKSVRSSLKQPLPVEHPSLYTYFTIDEDNFRIYLNHNSELGAMNEKFFGALLEDFIFLADEWRLFLDENDRNDLIFVPQG